MAATERFIPLAAEEIYAVLADPWSYGDWVVGSRDIHGVDGPWPEPGARFHHTQGKAPLVVKDTTLSLAADPPRSLTLEVRVRPFIVGKVDFSLDDRNGGTLVTMEEHPIGGLAKPVYNPLLGWLTKRRNDETLRRLSRLAVERSVPRSTA